VIQVLDINGIAIEYGRRFSECHGGVRPTSA